MYNSAGAANAFDLRSFSIISRTVSNNFLSMLQRISWAIKHFLLLGVVLHDILYLD